MAQKNFLQNNLAFFFFFVVGIASFLAYWMTGGFPLSFVAMGPPIFITGLVKSKLAPILVSFLSDSETGTVFTLTATHLDFGFLLPITLLYYTLIGLHVNHLTREQGILRLLAFLALFGFLAFIHYLAWSNISQYYIALY